MPFQLIYLPNVCEAYSRNIYMPATTESMNNDPTLILQKCFIVFDITYMYITDYELMQSLNAAHSTLVQLEKLSHKLPNYVMINYDSLKEQIQQIDENFPLLWLLIILIIVLCTLVIATGIAVYCFCKYKESGIN